TIKLVSASATSDLGGGDFVVKRATADLLHPRERPLDSCRTAATRGFPKGENMNGLFAIAEIQGVVGVAPARHGLAKVRDCPAHRHALAVKASRIGKDGVW